MFLFKARRLRTAVLCALPAWLSEAPGQVVPDPIQAAAPSVPITDPTRLARISPLGVAPDWSTLAAFGGTFTHEEFQQAWDRTYSAENALPPPFQIRPQAVIVPTGDPAKPEVCIEFRNGGAGNAPDPQRYWRRAAELPPLRDRPPLSDLHIALDPGHIGGQWARMEERFLSFQPGEAIQEGDLSLLTAQVLKERLTALGAIVTLVRDKAEPVTVQRPEDLNPVAIGLLKEMGITEPAATYDGLTGDAKGATVQWHAERLFYRLSEIHARAVKVNRQIKPDVVLCLHLNAEGWGTAETPQFSPLNHLHVLVNGCYAPIELEQADTRHEMFTRLFQRVHEEEIPLATRVAAGMADATGLPAYVYTTPNARHAGTNPHVYARNLLANRMYQCPVVYLEPFVMNHEETYRRLLAGHYVGRTLIGGRLTSSALEDYVRGVVQGLLNYYQTQRRTS